MPRFKLTIEYDGSGLCGWQRQNENYSVQAAIQKALFKATGQQVEVIASGRTDAGVHATGQVIHFDADEKWSDFKIKEAINFHLRRDEQLPFEGQVVAIESEIASPEFHARFDARKRHYLYRIINRRAHLSLEQNRAWHIVENLDSAAMHEAAQILVGKHDFTTFRSTECQAKSPIKTIDEINVSQSNELIEIKISARSFLHHQVRNIAGAMRLIGNQKWSQTSLKCALNSQNRIYGPPTAPPYGLYLVKVDY